MRTRKERFDGFSLMEVMVALVILGIISTICMQMSKYSQTNSGQSIDWQAEGVVIEKTIEALRVGHTTTQLQTLDSSWTDNTGQVRISASAKGGIPPASVCTGFPPSQLAQITVTARRLNFNDSIVVTTYLWVN